MIHEARRTAYLKAMGLPIWTLRGAPSTQSAQVDVFQFQAPHATYGVLCAPSQHHPEPARQLLVAIATACRWTLVPGGDVSACQDIFMFGEVEGDWGDVIVLPSLESLYLVPLQKRLVWQTLKKYLSHTNA